MTKRGLAFGVCGLAIVWAAACTIHKYPPQQQPGAAGAAPTATVPPPPPATGYDPCAGKSCGMSCTICDPADKNCVETMEVKQCDSAGKCSSGTAQCGTAGDAGTAYNPCAGKKCGERCNLCAPGDTSCIETALIKLCHPDSQCKPATTVDCTQK